MSITIRGYRPEDLESLQALTVEAFEPVCIDRNIEEVHGGSIHGKNWKYRKAQHIETDVSRDPQGIFVAEQQAVVEGVVSCEHKAVRTTARCQTLWLIFTEARKDHVTGLQRLLVVTLGV